ncbi:MAG: winged helix DNA-binding protein [Bacteroidales bacterium]|nr:winged helix DNA-binding protein [Bacteroidales bacterium]
MKYSFDTSFGNLTQRISKSLGVLLVKKIQERAIPVSAEQWCVISMLYNHKRETQTAIGLFLGYDKVKVLRLIADLERAGIVERFKDNDDKRFNIVKLTEKGSETYRKIEVLARDTLAEATNGLSAAEVKTCISMLKKISRNLEVNY